MRRGQMTGFLAGSAVALSLAAVKAVAAPAGASGVSLKVPPAKGLANGKVVTVSGTGLLATIMGKKNSFFLDECNAGVIRQLSVSDEPHCDVSVVKALRVSKGSSTTTFKVVTGTGTGTVGDATCGVAGHPTCVVGVGDTSGQGAVANITFK